MHKGYEKIERDGKTAWVLQEEADAVAGALFGQEACEPLDVGGRGQVQRFPLKKGHGILRKYLRGGVISRLLPDAYVLVNRPYDEFVFYLHLQEEKVAAPQVLGVCWERKGLLVRGAIATRELDGLNLYDWLQEHPDGDPQLMEQCGRLIRKMHDFHVWHADLQVRNIFITKDGPYLLDFANAKTKLHPSPLQRARNLLRLRRSFEKQGVPLVHFQQICDGYGVSILPEWLSYVYTLKGQLSDIISRQ